MGILSSLFGAFFGAGFAFLFNNIREDRKEQSNEKRLLMQVHFILGYYKLSAEELKKQLNDMFEKRETKLVETAEGQKTIREITKDYFENSDFDWTCYGLLPITSCRVDLPINQLFFLASHNEESKKILDDLVQMQSKYERLDFQINFRDKCYNEYYDFVHNLSGLKENVAVLSREFQTPIFLSKINLGKQATNNVNNLLQKIQDESDNILLKLDEYLQRYYIN